MLWLEAVIVLDAGDFDELLGYCEAEVDLPDDIPTGLAVDRTAGWRGGGSLIRALGIADTVSTRAALGGGCLYVRMHV